MPPSRLHRLLGTPSGGGALLACALAGLVAFGLLGVGRRDVSNLDVNFFYTAGHAWRQGLNPYDLATYGRVARSLPAVEEFRDRLGRGAPDVRGFSYPPNTALPAILLSMVPRWAAAKAVTSLNLLAMIAIALCTLRLMQRDEVAAQDPSARWVVLALALGNPFALHVLWIGQTTLFAAACLVAAWEYRRRHGARVVTGCLFALAAIKPQVAFLPILWLLLERDWRVLFSMVVASVALMVIPLVQMGPLTLARAWFASLSWYQALGAQTGDMNSPGFQNMFGVRDLLAASGVDSPTLVPIALGGVGALWFTRRSISDLETLGLLQVMSALFVYAHDYDLAMLVPFYVILWSAAGRRDSWSLAGAVVLALLFFPQRFLRDRVPPAALHWRELALIASLGLWFTLRRGRSLQHYGAPKSSEWVE